MATKKKTAKKKRPTKAKSHFDSIESIISDLRRGKIVIVVDDEDRENEGDLILAAEHATPSKINFLAKHGRGLICVPTTEDLNAIYLADDGQIFVAGDRGTLLRFDGNGWTAETAPSACWPGRASAWRMRRNIAVPESFCPPEPSPALMVLPRCVSANFRRSAISRPSSRKPGKERPSASV